MDATAAAEHPAGEAVEYAPLQRSLPPDAPKSIADYERLLESGPFVKPRPPFTYQPQLAAIADQSLIRGETLELQAKLSGWDPANGQAEFKLDEFSPASMTIDDEGHIAWSPKPTTETGDYPVGVVVTSPVNPEASLSVAFNVTLRDPNLPPTLTLPAEVQVAYVGRIWTLQATAEDPEQAGGLTYSLAGEAPAGLTIDARSGTLRWEVTPESEPGEVSVTVEVADAGEPAATASQTLTVKVDDDAAQSTRLVGCLGEGDQWTAFLYDAATNKRDFLKVGDEFKIADIVGKVASIDRLTLEFDDAKGHWRLSQDQWLRDAELLAASPTNAADSTADAPIEVTPADDPPPTAVETPASGTPAEVPAGEAPAPSPAPPAAEGDDAPTADR